MGAENNVDIYMGVWYAVNREAAVLLGRGRLPRVLPLPPPWGRNGLEMIDRIRDCLRALYLYIRDRNRPGYWYLYGCPVCGRKLVHKKWPNQRDPVCPSGCKTPLSRIM
jgi:hypothetical protein